MNDPFFEIGFQRSGTTLLRLMLDSHPDLAVPLDVTGLWSRYESRLSEYDDLHHPATRRRLVEDLLAEERIRLWEVKLNADVVLSRWTRPGYPGVIEALGRSYAAARGKKYWGDKDPGNMLHIAQLDRWFPMCKIIHVVRDGRGACLSHLHQSFGHDDLLTCAEDWREQVSWVRHIGQLLGSARYHEVKYESLLEDPPAELARITAFLGVPYSDQMLEYPGRVQEAVPDEKRHIWPLIGEAPRRDNATRWKSQMSRGTQICFEKRAGALLEELGYETTPKPWSGEYATELGFVLRRALRALRRRWHRFAKEPARHETRE